MMEYFDDPKNIQSYIEEAEGHDGREIISVLRMHLLADSTILELGMGPGTDLDMLAESYSVTGSDRSSAFLDLYRSAHPQADLLQLDAIDIVTDRTFDGIYSNKVLQHLGREELRRSFARQAQVLNPSGFVIHSFWYGDSDEEFEGLRFVTYTEKTLADRVGPDFRKVASKRYQEFDPDDSFYVLLKKV